MRGRLGRGWGEAGWHRERTGAEDVGQVLRHCYVRGCVEDGEEGGELSGAWQARATPGHQQRQGEAMGGQAKSEFPSNDAQGHRIKPL